MKRPVRPPSRAAADEGDALELPVVDATAPAAEALALMRRHARSGVIALDRGRCRVYEAARIVIALSDDPTAVLQDIAPSAELVARPAARPGATAVRPLPAGPGRGAKRRAGRGPAGSELAFEIDSTLLAIVSAGPRDCYCRIDRKPVIGGTTGADCPYGHRRSVRCV
jgi:CBS domain-containing protein